MILARDTLQRANAAINNDSATLMFLGSTIPLTISSSGCMYVQIGRTLDATNVETKKTLSRILFPSMTCGVTLGVKHKARKLHSQFCHPSADCLIELLKCAGTFDQFLFNSIKTVSEQCELCYKNEESQKRSSSSIERKPNVINSRNGYQSSSESESDDGTTTDDLQNDIDEYNLLDEWTYVSNNKTLPNVSSIIECKFANYDPIVKCKVLSKAGKSSAANWHYLNILENGEVQGKCCSFKNAFWRSVDNANGEVNED